MYIDQMDTIWIENDIAFDFRPRVDNLSDIFIYRVILNWRIVRQFKCGGHFNRERASGGVQLYPSTYMYIDR